MEKVWFTADTHFNHTSIIKHCNRPFFTVIEMNEKIINNWNEDVSRSDTVFILGDFAWNNHGHFVGSLKGKKILVTGSHDKMSQAVYNQFTEVHKGILLVPFNNNRFFLTHCPMLTWEGSHHGSINLHGHAHGRISEFDNKRRMDVGVDVWNFNPVPLGLISDIMNKRSFKHEDESLQNANDLLRKDYLIKRNTELLKTFNEGRI